MSRIRDGIHAKVPPRPDLPEDTIADRNGQRAPRHAAPSPALTREALQEALANARYSNDQTHGAHTHGRDEDCGGEYVVGNCIVRAALGTPPPAGLDALQPFAAFADPRRVVPPYFVITHGSSLAKRQLTMGDCYAAVDALAALSKTPPPSEEERA